MKEVVDGKKVTVYETVQKEIKKDLPSRLHARRQMLKVLYPVTEVPTEAAGLINSSILTILFKFQIDNNKEVLFRNNWDKTFLFLWEIVYYPYYGSDRRILCPY